MSTGVRRQYISRHLDPEGLLWKHRADLQFLAAMARNSGDKLQFAIRDGRVTLYHQGNLVCTVLAAPAKYGRPYKVAFGDRFVAPTHPRGGWEPLGEHWDLLDKIAEAAGSEGRLSGGYWYFNVTAGEMRHALDPAIVKRVMAAVRAIDYGGEIGFEQLFIAANQPRPGFIILDRQVADSHPDFRRQRMDVLALRRDDASGQYKFVVVELKLGANPAVEGDVIAQCRRYADHLSGDVAADYAATYRLNYEQMRAFGFYRGAGMPATVKIETGGVGKVVVIAHAAPGLDATIERLQKDNPDVHVHSLGFRLP